MSAGTQSPSRPLIIDCLAGHIVAPEPPDIDGRSYLERLIGSGVTVVNVTLAAHADSFEHLLATSYAYFNLIDARPEQTRHVRSVQDIDALERGKEIGIVFGMQTGTPVERDISKWRILYELGVRIAQLTYSERSLLGDGCFEPENRGITSYGKQAIQEMNRLGIALDISHAGERTSLEAIEYSQKPTICSHGNAKKRCPSGRNLTDQQLKAVADSGGVIGITPHSMMTYRTEGVRPTVDDYLAMVDYVVELVGIDHVGMGTDIFESYTKLSWESSTKRMYPSGFTYETMLTDGFSRISQLPDVIARMRDRGWRDEDLHKFLGENWRRVFEVLW